MKIARYLTLRGLGDGRAAAHSFRREPPAAFASHVAAIALASAMALNLLFALLPSWRTARLDPILARRLE